MKLAIFAITLSLVILADASKQLLCTAGEGSVLRFLVRDRAQSINCVANTTDDFQVTKDQYDNILSRLRATENELHATKLALDRLLNETTPGLDANRTQQMIDEAVNRTVAQMLRTIAKENTIKSLKADGWRTSGDFLFKVFLERVVYDAATRRCAEHGGRLAAEVLRRRDPIRYIINGNFAITYKDGREPWIGYTDRQSEGTWRWVDGGRTNPLTTAWNEGEPNNKGNEDCGSIAKTSGGKILINDSPCDSRLHYICEIDTNQIE